METKAEDQNWPKCWEQLSPSGYIHNSTSAPKAWETLGEREQRDCKNPKDRETCYEIESPRNGRHASLTVPQQGFLNKTRTRATPIDMLNGKEKISQGLTIGKGLWTINPC